jgi:hypothetical protein
MQQEFVNTDISQNYHFRQNLQVRVRYRGLLQIPVIQNLHHFTGFTLTEIYPVAFAARSLRDMEPVNAGSQVG